MASISFEPLSLPGLFRVVPRRQADARGTFVKPFSEVEFAAQGLVIAWAESYYSHSVPGVVRGMHCQTPPHQHAKLVCCVQGRVLDVALDLRPGPTFGQFETVELSAANGHALYLPEGFAHGFCVPDDQLEGATLLYFVSSAYAPSADTGVRSDSFGFNWPVATPTLSDRDLALPRLAEWPSLGW